MKYHHIGNCNFYKVLYWECKTCPFSSSAIQNLIKITLFKMMALCKNLVYDSEKWSTYQPFPVVILFLCLGPSFIGAVISIKVYCNFQYLNPEYLNMGVHCEYSVHIQPCQLHVHHAISSKCSSCFLLSGPNSEYIQLPPRQTQSGPAPTVHLTEVSALGEMK